MSVPPDRRSRALRTFAIIIPAALMGALAVSVALRTPLWRDEAATYGFALLDPAGLLQAVTHVDGVSTPYYLLESLVQRLVPGPFGLRLPSVLAAVGSTALVVAIGSRWWGTGAGFAAGLSFALNPLAVTMAANARPYALATFFAASALWFLHNAVRDGRRRQWVGYAIAVALAGLTHLLAVTVVPAFLVLAWGTRRRVLAWLISTAAAAIVVLPIALVGYLQRGQVSWIEPLSARGTVGALAGLLRPDGDLTLRNGVALLALMAGAAAAYVVFRRVDRRTSAQETAVVAVLLVAPWSVLTVASAVSSPILQTNYLAPSSLGVALVIGAAVGAAGIALRGRIARRIGIPVAVALAALAVVPVAVGVGFLVPFAQTPRVVDDVPALADRLDSVLSPGDRLVVLQPYPDGGVTPAVALYTGDRAWLTELEGQLPSAGQPQVNIRTVRSVDPLVTVPGGRSGRIWVVGSLYATGETDLPDRAFSELGCSDGGSLTAVADYGITLYRGRCVTG